jgi:hypothetical protein
MSTFWYQRFKFRHFDGRQFGGRQNNVAPFRPMLQTSRMQWNGLFLSFIRIHRTEKVACVHIFLRQRDAQFDGAALFVLLIVFLNFQPKMSMYRCSTCKMLGTKIVRTIYICTYIFHSNKFGELHSLSRMQICDKWRKFKLFHYKLYILKFKKLIKHIQIEWSINAHKIWIRIQLKILFTQ